MSWFGVSKTRGRIVEASGELSTFIASLDNSAVEDINMVAVGDSTGNNTTEWIYLLAQRIGLAWPEWTVRYYIWDTTDDRYEDGSGSATYVTVQTGTGSRILTVYNASVAGQDPRFFLGEYFDEMVTDNDPDVVIVNHGHNLGAYSDATSYNRWRGEMHGLIEEILLRCKNAQLFIALQNPATNSTDNDRRALEISRIASEYNALTLDISNLFRNYTSWDTALMTDTVHPNALGSGLIAAEAVRIGRVTSYTRQSGKTQAHLSSAAPGLIPDSNLDTGILDGWVLTNMTVAADSTYEDGTKAYSLKLTSVAGAASSAYYRIANYANFAEKWVTAAFRVYIPSGELSTVGRIYIADGVTTVTSQATTNGQGGWFWLIRSFKVAASPTKLEIGIYADTATAGGSVCYVSEIHVVEGPVPRKAVPFSGGKLRFLSTTSGNSQVTAGLPTNARLHAIVANVASGTPDLTVGNASGNASIVSATGALSAGRQDLTLASRYSSTGNLWVSSDAAVNIDWTFLFDLVG